MNYLNSRLRLSIGDKVRIKDDLVIGSRYYNETQTISNSFTIDMAVNKGRLAEIIGFKEGQYILDLDNVHLYTYGMLLDLTVEDDPEFAKSDYVFDKNVEALLDKLMKDQHQRLLDKALEERLFETSPEKFQEIASFL